jgi:ADP-ribose pyrophosphatase YjhB (NUDIX family)
MTRFGFFGPSDKHDRPLGGLCISTFALVSREGLILAVRPKLPEKWEKEWTPNWRLYEPAQLQKELASWRLPSTYVKEGEAPRDALDRVMADQLGIGTYVADSSSMENFYEASRRYPGEMHWDYCFVFHVSTKEEPKEQAWVAESQYLHPTELKGRLGSAQESLLARLGLL